MSFWNYDSRNKDNSSRYTNEKYQQQKQSQKQVNIQKLQQITLDIDNQKTSLKMIDEYIKNIYCMIKSPSKQQSNICEAINVGVVSSIDQLGYQIQCIRSRNDVKTLKLMQNEFVKYWKEFNNKNHHQKVEERILPLLKFIVLAFQGKKLPKIAIIKFPEEEFTQELVNRSVNNVAKSKKKMYDLEENVKKNKLLYHEKYLKELNTNNTEKVNKFIQTMKINSNDINLKSLYKDGNKKYKLKNPNNTIKENQNYSNAPNLFGDDEDENNNNNNNNSKHIDLKFLKKGDYIDYRCKDGIYRCFQIFKIDKIHQKIVLALANNPNRKQEIKLNSYTVRCIFKSGSMSNNSGEVWFNHYYFSQNNKWSLGYIDGFKNGHIKIDTQLKDPKYIYIHVNDYQFINFNTKAHPEFNNNNNSHNNNHNHNHNHNNDHHSHPNNNNNNNMDNDFQMRGMY